MRSASELMSRYAGSAIYRLRPDHGVAFLDIELSVSQLARANACFVEEKISIDGDDRLVLLPLDDDSLFDDGSAWHPETFKPLGPNEAIRLSGYQGIAPLVGSWLPLPYLRMMTGTAGSDPVVDEGPCNWVRVYVVPPVGPLHETETLKAVIAIDTRLDGNSRLDQRRYNAPSAEDVSLGSTFVLTDKADHIADLLTEPWLDDWLRDAFSQGLSKLERDVAVGEAVRPAHHRFQQEHVARYLFLLKVLCGTCPIPILRFAAQSRERIAAESIGSELVIDLADEVGLAVLAARQSQKNWATADVGLTRVLPIRDLGRPGNIHAGALPIRVEFDASPFGPANISRRSGRSNAFNWSSLVRVGEEATRIAMRSNATDGRTGAGELARNVHDDAVIEQIWRSSSDDETKPGPPPRSVSMQYLAENGALLGLEDDAQPALRPRFSRASLLTFFIAELVLHAVTVLNAPRKTTPGESSAQAWEELQAVRLSLPVSLDPAERDALLQRAHDSIDLVWRAEGWENEGNARTPTKPTVELGLGGDFGVQLIYLHNELNEIYGGDLQALLEDLDPVSRPSLPASPAAVSPQTTVRLASINLGYACTRAVVADYNIADDGGIRPRLVSTQTVPRGLNVVEGALVDWCVIPAIEKALRRAAPDIRTADFERLIARSSSANAKDSQASEVVRSRRIDHKIFRPAARAILDIHSSLVGNSGVELFTLAGLVQLGGGRLAPLSDQIEKQAAALGAHSFQLGEVTVSVGRYAFRQSAFSELGSVLSDVALGLDAEHADLVFITSAFAASNETRRLLLSLLPISPHRLIVLDEQWGLDQERFAVNIPIAARVGALSTIVGKQRLDGYDTLAGIERALRIASDETEVA